MSTEYFKDMGSVLSQYFHNSTIMIPELIKSNVVGYAKFELVDTENIVVCNVRQATQKQIEEFGLQDYTSVVIYVENTTLPTYIKWEGQLYIQKSHYPNLSHHKYGFDKVEGNHVEG